MAGDENGRPWTVDTLRMFMQRQIDDMRLLLDERYATQTKAIDAAFIAQQTSVQAALAAAKEAVVKAESAAEKRFEAVNEFRAQLTDQAATFLPREVYDAQHADLRKQLDRNTELIITLQSMTTSHDASKVDLRAKTQSAVALFGAGIALIATLAGVIALIVHG